MYVSGLTSTIIFLGALGVAIGAEVASAHVGVDFGGAYVDVSQHRLDSPQVDAALDHVGGEGMAELVRRDDLADHGGSGVATQQLPEPLAGHHPSAGGQK